jgi:hypothetical protein
MEVNTMKKLIIILLILMIPIAAFADFRLGPTAYYNFPLIQDSQFQPPALDGLDAADFSFGADFRLKLWIFHFQGMALFTPGVKDASDAVVLPASTDLHVDAGLAFDLLFLRLGLGVGPSWAFFFGDADTVSAPTSMGMNGKATADILLGPVSIGISYLMQFDFDLKDANQVLSADKTQGLFGVAFLLKL